MAKVKKPAHIRKLENALKQALRKAGVGAMVGSEAIPDTKLHRVLVLSPQFDSLSPSERQNLVWRIAQQVLDFDEQVLITSILTLTPEEAGLTAPRKKKRLARSQQGK